MLISINKRKKIFLVATSIFLVIFFAYKVLIFSSPREIDAFPILLHNENVKLDDKTVALVNFDLDTSGDPFPNDIGFVAIVYTSDATYRQVIDSCKNAGSDDGTHESGYGNWFCDDRYYSFSLESENVVVTQKYRNIKKVSTRIPVSETVRRIEFRFPSQYKLE